MAAAAFKVSLNVVNSAGNRRSIYLTASDVNAAAMVFPSGGTEIQLSSQVCAIADMILSAAGTDTTNTSLFVNGIDTGIRIIHAANLGTTINRQVATNPITIPAGAVVKFVQNT
jgi:hypothetical protein